MRKSIIFPILLVGLFFWGNLLNEKNPNKKDKVDSENQTQDNENVNDLEKIKQECVKLGCDEGSVYIGSKNSDKFYKCDCRWTETISSKNIICFKTAQEALDDNRTESEC